MWKSRALRCVDRNLVLCLLVFLFRPSVEIVFAAISNRR